MKIRATAFLALMLAGGLASAQRETAPAPKLDAARSAALKAGILSAKLEPAAAGRTSVSVIATMDLAAKLRVFDAAGAEVAIKRDDSGIIRAEIDPKQLYLLAPPAPERRALTKAGFEFPARYLTFTPAGATNLGGLFLRPASMPLTWDDQAKTYATELIVGYEFTDGREIALPTVRTVSFFAEGANARIQADRVTIERSGGAGYKRVQLTTSQTEGEIRFTARAGPVDELKSSVSVEREVGGITLTLPSTELPAFGIGAEKLTVSLVARDGMPITAPRPLDVQLTSRRLRQPASLRVEQGQSTATAEIRTAGFGADQIVAVSGAFRAELPVKLLFPVAAVVAALIGGACGGGARYLRNKGKRGGLLVRRLVEGMLVGLILVGAAWTGLVGFEMSAGVLGTPFGAFVLGALGGYLGCVVLDRVAKKALGGSKMEE